MSINLSNVLSQDAFWIINKRIARSLGLECAMILGDLITKRKYFEDKGQLIDGGFFFNTQENIEEDTTLSPYKQRKAIKILEKEGFLETKTYGMPAKTYYKVLDNKIGSFLTTRYEETSQQDVKKLYTNKNTETRINNNSTTSVVQQSGSITGVGLIILNN